MADEVTEVKPLDLNLSDGHSNKGPAAPAEPANTPPIKELTVEEKAAADKATADAAAAKTLEAETAKKEADDKAVKDAADAAALEEGKKAYATYNDSVADSVIDLLKESNVTPEESDGFFRKAVESGNMEDIDRAALEAKVGKAKANLVIVGITDYYNRISSSVKAVTEAVYSVVGSKTNFDKVAKWAREKETVEPAFKGELDSYRKMLEGTPTSAKLAADALLKAYHTDPKNSSLDVTRVDGDSRNEDSAFIPLSRADYIKGLHEANMKNDPEAVKALNARRTASIKIGK